MGHTASQAELDRVSSRLLRSYAARCAARAELRDRMCDEDREHYEPGVFSVVPDGVLATARKGSTWSLWLEWSEEYGRRLLAQGTREQVEHYAIEVAVHGPPGGPDLRDQEPAWRDIGGDGTLRLLALGGEFRLMPLFDGGHILTFARNDSPLRVLGIGDAAELQRTAVQRLERCRGDVLNVVLRGERIELRGVAAAGVLGYLELHDGLRLLLGHLTGERFGLFYVRGDSGDCVGIYDFDMLRRGDLREVLEWESPDIVDTDDGDGAEGHDGRDDRPQAEPEPRAWAAQTPHVAARPRPVVEPEPRARTAQTPRVAARPRPVVEPEPRARATPQPRQQPASPTHRARLSAADLELLDLHLTPTTPVIGKGKTMVPQLLAGILGLANLDLPNLLMRGCDLQRLMKAELRIEFHCCSKTFGQALAAIATRTPLLNPVGKRWALPLGDLRRVESELMDEIARITGAANSEAQTTSPRSKPPATDPESAAPPATSTNSPRKSEPHAQPAATPASASSTGGTPRSPEPPAPQPAAELPNTPTSEPGPPSPPAGKPAPRAPADHPSHGAPLQPEGDREALVDLEWLLANGHRHPHPWRRDGRLRVTMASVPDSQSASRWAGKEPRGPPWWW